MADTTQKLPVVETTNSNSQAAAAAEAKASIFTMPVSSYALAFVLACWKRMLNPSLTTDYVNLYGILKAEGWTVASASLEDAPKATEGTESTKLDATESTEKPKTEETPKSNSKTGFGYFAGLTGQIFMRVLSALPVTVAFVAHEVVNAAAIVVGAAVALIGLPFDLVLGAGNGVVAGFQAVGAWWSDEDEDGSKKKNDVVNAAGAAAVGAPEVTITPAPVTTAPSAEEQTEQARIAKLAEQYKALQDAANGKEENSDEAQAVTQFDTAHADDMDAIKTAIASGSAKPKAKAR